jgi:hypothetical protein
MPVTAGRDTLDYILAISTAVAAAGTLLAVLVALYLNVWREARKRPRLNICFDDPERAGGAGFQGNPTGPNAVRALPDLPVRVRVSNEPGRRTAHDVEVLLTASWVGEDGDPYAFVESTPLVWSPHHRLEGRETQLAIPPGVGRTIDLLTYGLPEAVFDLAQAPPGTTTDPGVFALLHIWPFSFDEHLLLVDRLEYRFRFVITARDVDARVYETALRLGFHDVAATPIARFVDLEWGELREAVV